MAQNGTRRGTALKSQSRPHSAELLTSASSACHVPKSRSSPAGPAMSGASDSQWTLARTKTCDVSVVTNLDFGAPALQRGRRTTADPRTPSRPSRMQRCRHSSPVGVLTLTATKRPLAPATGAATNGRCSRCSCRRPLSRRFAMPATASAPHELALPTLKRHSLSRSHRPEAAGRTRT